MTDDDRTPAERRVRRISLAALAVVLPLTIAAQSWRSYADHRKDGETDAIEVPVKGKAAYAGANWTLGAMKSVGSREAGPMIPAGRMLVHARFDVEVTGTVGTRWEQCRVALMGEDGRRWLGLDDVPHPLRRLLTPSGNLRDCRGAGIAPPKPGQRVSIDEVFFVPESELPKLRAVLSTLGGRPAYLRFTLPGKIES